MAEIAHAQRSHALLGASGSHRWLHCTPSARLEETLPDKAGQAAAKGTLAHEMAELKLRKHFLDPIGPRKFTAAMKKMKDNPLYEPDMDTHTTAYLDYVQSVVHRFPSPPYVAVEKRVDYSHIAPEGFGTSDCIVIGGKQLHIIDYKNGQGVPVPAEDNPQMKLYALGALRHYGLLYEIETVHLAIVQPKVWDVPSEWALPVADLLAWGESIKPVAQLAFKGEGEFIMGDHCKFCRAFPICRVQRDSAKQVEVDYSLKALPPVISPEEAAEALARIGPYIAWAKKLQEWSLSYVLAGNELPGWKAVHGRGGREYVNLDAAFAHLQAYGVEEALLYERKPLTVPAVEKILKAADYKKLLVEPGHVLTKPGAPTLVPESDKREAITRISAADDFKPTSEEEISNG